MPEIFQWFVMFVFWRYALVFQHIHVSAIVSLSAVYQETPCSDIDQAYCFNNLQGNCTGVDYIMVHSMMACPVQHGYDKHVRCCVPQPYQEEPCRKNGGLCIDRRSNGCAGTTVTRKCPTQKRFILCCVGNSSTTTGKPGNSAILSTSDVGSTIEPTTDNNSPNWILVAVLLVAIFLLILIVVAVDQVLLFKINSKVAPQSSAVSYDHCDNRHNSVQLLEVVRQPKPYVELPAQGQPTVRNWKFCIPPQLRIDIDNISLDPGDIVGIGHFGTVFKAEVKLDTGATEVVAMKVLQASAGVYEFLQEGLRMSKLDHENVLELIGITFLDKSQQEPALLTTFMECGSLQTYLRDLPENQFVSPSCLIRFGIQIADGMSYLHDHKIMHRDLAARNCMLDEDWRVKIADFGLSREVDASGAYCVNTSHRRLPIEWLPPESFRSGRARFTLKLDLWSFGVVLWEITSKGETPYDRQLDIEGLSSDCRLRRILEHINSGRRLDKPANCPLEMHDIFQSYAGALNQAFVQLRENHDRLLARSAGRETDISSGSPRPLVNGCDEICQCLSTTRPDMMELVTVCLYVARIALRNLRHKISMPCGK